MEGTHGACKGLCGLRLVCAIPFLFMFSQWLLVCFVLLDSPERISFNVDIMRSQNIYLTYIREDIFRFISRSQKFVEVMIMLLPPGTCRFMLVVDGGWNRKDLVKSHKQQNTSKRAF